MAPDAVQGGVGPRVGFGGSDPVGTSPMTARRTYPRTTTATPRRRILTPCAVTACHGPVTGL